MLEPNKRKEIVFDTLKPISIANRPGSGLMTPAFAGVSGLLCSRDGEIG